MKKPSKNERQRAHARQKNLRKAKERLEREERVTELLKICLQKVCEMQADLQKSEDEEQHPEAAGYAACASEALRFLADEGLDSDHPLVKTLTERLSRNNDQ